MKDGHIESSCLWTVCFCDSGAGKTPALKKISGFYTKKHFEMLNAWVEKKAAQERKRKHPVKGVKHTEDDVGPQPEMLVTDTTMEGLQRATRSGAILYLNDEVSQWCQSMSQYKKGNADKPVWCSIWSHSPIVVKRSNGEGCLAVQSPFVSVVGVTVPEAAQDLNFRGREGDGFMPRILIAYPPSPSLVFSREGVPEKDTDAYDKTMARLFEVPKKGTEVLAFSAAAFDRVDEWLNNTHYPEVQGDHVPKWLRASYVKLEGNFWRICLVIHELRRVAEDVGERTAKFNSQIVDAETVERAIKVIGYFKRHIDRVHAVLLGKRQTDRMDELWARCKDRTWEEPNMISLRECQRLANCNHDGAKRIFDEWEQRNYGEIRQGNHAGRVFFVWQMS